MKKEDLTKRKTNAPRITGVTTINHSNRIKLGLTCDQYVLASCLADIIRENKDPLTSRVFRRTGFSEQAQEHLLLRLIEKGILYPTSPSEPIKLSNKWYDLFAEIEREFEEDFWTDKDGKTAWPGSKKKAKELYIKLRKKEDKEYILRQKRYYFKLLHYTNLLGFDRSKMMATVFLGPQERYSENWKEQADEKEKKYKALQEKRNDVITPANMTQNDKNNLYAEDSNQ